VSLGDNSDLEIVKKIIDVKKPKEIIIKKISSKKYPGPKDDQPSEKDRPDT
jgi:hypothetical protein